MTVFWVHLSMQLFSTFKVTIIFEFKIIRSVPSIIEGDLNHVCREGKALGSAEAMFKKTNDYRVGGKWGSWAQELRNIAFHPEKHSPAALEITEEAVVISDKFAKVLTVFIFNCAFLFVGL